MVIVGGYVVDRIGYRRASLLFSFIMCLGMVVLSTSRSYTQLLVGRFVFGA